MLRTTATILLLLSAGSLLPLSVSAQVPAGAEIAIPLPPPPGPYVSSRPQLEPRNVPQRNNNRLPFVANMPVAPMRYMPSYNQPPSPPQWWRGPMGR